MDAQAKSLYLNRTKIVGGRVLQTLDIARRETNFDAADQPYDHAVAFNVIMRAVRSWPAKASRPTGFRRLEPLSGQFNHGNASMRPTVLSDVRRQREGSDPFACDRTR